MALRVVGRQRKGRDVAELCRLRLHRGAQGGALRRLEPAGGVAQRQRRHPLGMPERHAEPGPATHRLRDDRRPVDPLGVKNRGEVVDEMADPEIPLEIAARPAEAAMIEGERAVVAHEMRHLLPPARRIAAATMREDDPWAGFAGDLVVDLGVARGDHGHGDLLSVLRKD